MCIQTQTDIFVWIPVQFHSKLSFQMGRLHIIAPNRSHAELLHILDPSLRPLQEQCAFGLHDKIVCAKEPQKEKKKRQLASGFDVYLGLVRDVLILVRRIMLLGGASLHVHSKLRFHMARPRISATDRSSSRVEHPDSITQNDTLGRRIRACTCLQFCSKASSPAIGKHQLTRSTTIARLPPEKRSFLPQSKIIIVIGNRARDADLLETIAYE